MQLVLKTWAFYCIFTVLGQFAKSCKIVSYSLQYLQLSLSLLCSIFFHVHLVVDNLIVKSDTLTLFYCISYETHVGKYALFTDWNACSKLNIPVLLLGYWSLYHILNLKCTCILIESCLIFGWWTDSVNVKRMSDLCDIESRHGHIWSQLARCSQITAYYHKMTY